MNKHIKEIIELNKKIKKIAGSTSAIEDKFEKIAMYMGGSVNAEKIENVLDPLLELVVDLNVECSEQFKDTIDDFIREKMSKKLAKSVSDKTKEILENKSKRIILEHERDKICEKYMEENPYKNINLLKIDSFIDPSKAIEEIKKVTNDNKKLKLHKLGANYILSGDLVYFKAQAKEKSKYLKEITEEVDLDNLFRRVTKLSGYIYYENELIKASKIKEPKRQNKMKRG